MTNQQLITKYFKEAVRRNETANAELKRAALTSTEIMGRVRSEVAREISLLLTKHKQVATDSDVEFMVSSYVELYLGLASAYHAQTAFQKQKAKQDGGLKTTTRDEIGLDAQGNGTVEIDGVEVKVGEKPSQSESKVQVQ